MKISRFVFGIAALVIGALMTAAPVFAIEYGGGSVQAYAADAPIENGTIVQLAGDNSNRVKVATQSELQNLFGVAVDRMQLPVIIAGEDLENETFVAISGTYSVLVSTQNGAIKEGDYISLSSISGVGMKAGTEELTVFGRAVDSFSGSGINLGTMQLRDVNGNPGETVTLGSIPVAIDIRRNPNEKSTEVNLPDILQRIGYAIADKEVDPVRIYLSLGIAGVSLIAAIAILYSGVRNSVVSIGRNPMSKKSIFRALLQVILTSLVILIIGLFAVYLLLRL